MGKPIINAAEFAEIPASDTLSFASIRGRFVSEFSTFYQFSLFKFFLSPILSFPLLTGSTLG
jgi:hypothetical protein